MQDVLHRLTTTVTGNEQVYLAADEVLQDLIGHRLFTVLQYEPTRNLVSRSYSSDPDNFPIGGSKPLGDTPWGRQVLRDGKTLISTTRKELQQVYPDYELIFSLGLGSAVNIPVTSDGRVLGMLNLLHEEYYYTPEKLQNVDLIAELLAGSLSRQSKPV